MLEKWRKRQIDSAGDYFAGLDRPPDPVQVEKAVASGNVQRASNLRMVLSGGAPGMWASDHYAELQHCTGWNFVAVHAFALQFAGANISCFGRRPPKKSQRGPLPQDPIDQLKARLDRLTRRNYKAIGGEQATQDSQERIPLDFDHPLNKLMRRPNPDQSGSQFRFQMAQQMGLTGGAIVWILRDGRTRWDPRGTPREMYVIPTGLAYPQPASARYPLGWYRVMPMATYGFNMDADGFGPPGSMGSLLVNGGEIDKRDCRAIGWPHPLFVSDWLSALSAGAIQVDLAEELDKAIVSRFRNEGRPGLVFGWESLDIFARVPEEEIKGFRADVRARNNGTHNTGNDLLLPPGMTADTHDANPREMDFTGSRPQARDGVLALHHTPPTAAGINEAASYASLFASLKQFTELKVQPNLDMVYEEMREELCPAFGPGTSLEAKARSIDDPALHSQKMDRLQTRGLVTVDEARADEGKPPHEDKEYGKLPAGTTWQAWQQVKQQAEQAKQQAQQQPGQPGQQPGPGGEQDPLAALMAGGGAEEKPNPATDTTTGMRQENRDAPAGRADAMTVGKAANLDAAKPHKFASTMFELPEPAKQQILDLAARIPDDDLAEDGREDKPHVTALYGLHVNDPMDVLDTLRGFGPVRLKIGRASLFRNPDADVLKLDVASEDLHRLNQQLRDSLPCTITRHEYIPHATIAYLKPGLGDKWLATAHGLDGTEITLDRLVFSSTDGRRSVVPLGKPQAPSREGDGREKSFDAITTKALDKHSRDWLRLHGIGEREISAAQEEFLNVQADNLRDAIEADLENGTLPDELTIRRLFDEQAFADEHRDALLPALLAAASRGAVHQWKQFSPEDAKYEGMSVEGDAKEKAKKKLDAVWWLAFALFIREGLALAARRAAAAGLTGADFAAAAVAPIEGEHAKAKARNFGVTESTGMTNFGEEVARKHLDIAGLKFKRIWWTVQDDRVRPTHQAAHGQVEDAHGQFTVGGHTCDFPGDPALPIEERQNCRCVVLTLTTSAPIGRLPGRPTAGRIAKSFDESKIHRDHGKFSHTEGSHGETKKPHDHASIVHGWLSHEQNSHVSEEVRAKIGKAMTETLTKMPPAMAKAAVERMAAPPKLYSSLDDVTEAFKGRGETVAADEKVGGFYTLAEKTIHVDHGFDGDHEDAIHIYAHELTHCIDSDSHLSRTPEWTAAYNDEIKRKGAPLSEYALSNKHEGFAEFGRVVVTQPTEAKEYFPRCWKFFESNGLI